MKRSIAISLPPASVAVLLAIGLLLMPRSVAATTCAWTGATTTDWATASNWSGCLVLPPGSSDLAVIDSQANQPVLAGGTTAALSGLTLNPGAILQVSGGLTTTDATLGGQLSVQPGGLMFLNGGNLTISGTLAVQSGGLAHIDLNSRSATVLTTGVLSGAGDILLTDVNLGGGQLFVNSATNLGGLLLGRYGFVSFNAPAVLARLSFIDTLSYLQGTADITVTQAMTFTGGYTAGNGILVIAPSATLTVDTPDYLHLIGSRRLHNFGIMNWRRGSFSADDPSFFINEPTGVLNVLGNAQFYSDLNSLGAVNIVSGTLTSSVRLNGGALTMAGGGLITSLVLHGATLQGSGVITGTVVNSGGNIAPGNPLGALTIEGSLLDYSGTVSIDLGGIVPGVGYDVLNVTGQATLGGELVISQTNGFLANAGDSFQVMNYGSLYFNSHFITITNPIVATQAALVDDHGVLLAASAAQTRISVRPDVPVSERGSLNGYTLSVFNPTVYTVTVHNITDTLASGFSYRPGTTTGATAAEPNLSIPAGLQILAWPGAFTLAPTSGITLNFGVFASSGRYQTYFNSPIIRVSLSVTDVRLIAVDGVAPIIVTLRVSDNYSIVGPGARVQATDPPQILIRRPTPGQAGHVPITIIAHIFCPFASCGTIQNVFLLHGPMTYTMSLISSTVSTMANGPASGGGYGFWQGTIPGEGVIPGVPIKIFPDWDDHHPCSGPDQLGCVPGDPGPGTPGFYDPSGHVTDAHTGLPIPTASVTLFRAPALQPDTRTVTNGCPTVNTRPGGIGGTWDSLPPANTSVGALEDPLLSPAQIDPAVNPQLTNDQGYFGWSVVTGCWFVMASAPGYASKVSPLVGVPPEVTDLNIALQPVAAQSKLYLPLVRR